jgi:3-oxoadipate enol-lactonase
VSNLQNDLAAGSAEGYANCCAALAKADVREQLKTITVPILIVAGQQDPVTTVADAQFMQAQIPQSQLVEIDASHISNVEQPSVFNRNIVNFLKSQTL